MKMQMVDKFVYHPAPFSKFLYEFAPSWQVFLCQVLIPLYLEISGWLCKRGNGSKRCVKVIQRIQSPNRDRSLVGVVVEDIKTFATSLSSVTFCHISRRCNNSAHTMARRAEFVGSCLFRVFAPECIRDKLCFDVIWSIKCWILKKKKRFIGLQICLFSTILFNTRTI
jgi:hypothetical protein